VSLFVLARDLSPRQVESHIRQFPFQLYFQLYSLLHSRVIPLHQWNLQFHGVLTGLGFKQMYADAGIYVCHQQEGDGPLFVILYVDDITILGRSLQAVQ
jgi:hypothetical protein